MASPSALTLPAAAPARHFPISRRGRRAPRRQHPTGPLGGRDVRPCAGARSAARSGRASIVARDGPGLTISTVMDVPFLPALGDASRRARAGRLGMEGPFWPLAVSRGETRRSFRFAAVHACRASKTIGCYSGICRVRELACLSLNKV